MDEGLDPVQGAALMDQAAGIARMVADEAIADAIGRGGDSGGIDDAQQALAVGDTYRMAQAFKDAVASYRAAVASAEGA